MTTKFAFKWPLPTSRNWLYGYGSAGVLAGVILAVIFSSWSNDSAPVPPPSNSISPEAVEMANAQLNWAHGQSSERLEQAFAPVDALFNSARPRAFAETCLGWQSKWLLIKDKLNTSNEHIQLIEQSFRTSIFDQAELERLLQQCTTAYVQELNSIDGEMLVRLRADLATLPAGTVPALFDSEMIQANYRESLQRAIAASQSDLLAEVGREVVSDVVGNVITAAVVKLGVSSGILGTSAASGVATAGLGLAIGFGIDLVITEITDPVGKLTVEMDGRLRTLKEAILNGTSESPGLIPRLRAFSQTRGIARRDAVQELLSQPNTTFAAY